MKQSAMQILCLAAVLGYGAHAFRAGDTKPAAAAFLSVNDKTSLRPEVVANMLVNVEDKWKGQAVNFIECNKTADGDCSSSVDAFQKSCNTVATAVIQASNGDRNVVKEYMGDVCGVSKLAGWRQEQCQSLGEVLTKQMSANSYDNRENLDTAAMCKKFWSSFVVFETAAEAKEAEQRAQQVKEEAAAAAAHEAEEAKKEAEEAEKRKAEETEAQAQQEREAAAAKADADAREAQAKKEKQEQLEQKAKDAEEAAEAAKAKVQAVNQTAAPVAAVQNATTENATVAVEAVPEAVPQTVNATSENATVVAANVSAPVEAAPVAAAEVEAPVASNATAPAPENATAPAEPQNVTQVAATTNATNATNATPSAI